MLTATVSGSFRRHLVEISAAVLELAKLSVRVLSPADPRIVEHQGEFAYVASDRVRSVRLVQDRHLDSVRAANFLWLICPDGYVGQSASMEIGYAAAVGTPILAAHAPCDLTLRQYVNTVPSLADAVRIVAASPRQRRPEGILIDPHASVEEAHHILERIEVALTRRDDSHEPAGAVYRGVADLQAKLGLPTYMQ